MQVVWPIWALFPLIFKVSRYFMCTFFLTEPCAGTDSPVTWHWTFEWREPQAFPQWHNNKNITKREQAVDPGYGHSAGPLQVRAFFLHCPFREGRIKIIIIRLSFVGSPIFIANFREMGWMKSSFSTVRNGSKFWRRFRNHWQRTLPTASQLSWSNRKPTR